MMTRDEVLSKITKLLALSQGTSNINEASAAAGAAQKLMDEYNIERCSVDAQRPIEKSESVESGEPVISGTRIENWRFALLNQIARLKLSLSESKKKR
jgi:hypothetical protein